MPARSTYAKKRPASSRRAPMKSAYKKRSTYAPKDSDSMNLLCTSYFEVATSQNVDPALALGGTFGYSLKCDPVQMAIVSDKTGSTLGVETSNASNTVMADGAFLPFERLASFLTLYRQYKVNSVRINVTVDRESGLDNAIIMLQDKGNGIPITQVGIAMSQAHKSKVMTESDRTMSYGWTPKTADEKEFHTINDTISNVRAQYIKVLQQIEAKAGGKSKHRIEVIASVTLRDSKSGN